MNRSAAALIGSTAIALLVSCTAPSNTADSGTTAMGAAAGTLAEPNISEIRSAIESANQRWVAAMMAGDAGTAVGNYADDAIVMMPMMPQWNGRAAIEAGLKEMMAMMKVNDAKASTVDVMAGGDLAIETGMFSMTTTMTGAKPITENGKYLTVWKRQADGGWKILRDISNANGVATPAK